MDQTALAQLTALLLLISPFFFWGTSMVAFKVAPCQPLYHSIHAEQSHPNGMCLQSVLSHTYGLTKISDKP